MYVFGFKVNINIGSFELTQDSKRIDGISPKPAEQIRLNYIRF